MFRVGLVLESSRLLAKLTSLHIWGEITQFEIEAVCTNLLSLQELLDQKPFDLLIIENRLVQADDYLSLKNIRFHKSCRHIALCSTDEDIEPIRSRILLEVDDYYTLPFREDLFLALFDSIKAENANIRISTEELTGKLLTLFTDHDDSLHEYLEYLYRMNILGDVIDSTVKILFDKHDWLDLYVNEKDFLSSDSVDFVSLKNKFTYLFDSYRLLLPEHSDNLKDIFQYILYNPENDLRQKTLSEKLHMNKSYLSMVFLAQTDTRFVDYISYVKLMRAAWLLKNTDMKVVEVAGRMNYKDVAYFSRQFKKLFKITPSQYRLPDDYHFVI